MLNKANNYAGEIYMPRFSSSIEILWNSGWNIISSEYNWTNHSIYLEKVCISYMSWTMSELYGVNH